MSQNEWAILKKVIFNDEFRISRGARKNYKTAL